MSYLKKADVFAYLDGWAEHGSTTATAFMALKEKYPYSGKNPGRFEDRLARLAVQWADARREQEDEEEAPEPTIGGTIEAPEDTRQWADGKTFVFTSAQANTVLNERFWASLMMLVEDRGAELHISRFTYNKGTHGKKSVKPGSAKASDHDDLWFDPRIEPYVSDESVQIAADLIWCGELNIIPTRVDPITGFENYGRGASVILPHTKMAMRSVPTMKFDPPRYAYTTGTVTARNYIEKAAGQKASLHHVYGALLVEVDENGDWWARQINADNDGTIYDLTDMYKVLDNGTKIVDRQVRAEIVTHGDLHGNKVDKGVLDTMSDVIDILYPRNQVFHDTVDFQPRNHHNIKDPHFLHEMHVKGLSSVEDEFKRIAELMGQYLARPGTKHWIITSNHDQAIEGWLRNTVGFHDPANQDLWLHLNNRCAQQRKRGRKSRPFAYMMDRVLPNQYQWKVIDEDESLMIAGIENGLHGHLGPNGARGNPKNLRTVGKANTGHTHSAGITEGVYTAGVFGELDMGYNKGLSSWSHSFIITYPNGKRTICTIKNGKAWR
ncbi:DNA transfer protein [Paracoccus phage ParMal1]|uniref:DNA transfer protein n=1 Tax=Paracoccus phage ParMal1 TaxID=3032416 RepID=A0AAF0JI85_9CAUD|nr:DNA transfer protein [Paracoccus phage ParMal1]